LSRRAAFEGSLSAAEPSHFGPVTLALSSSRSLTPSSAKDARMLCRLPKL
jgi:hypothetical protein